GRPRLRALIADLMAQHGVQVTERNVLVTSGSQQALDLIAMAFLDPGDTVLVESPGYIGGIQSMRAYEATLVPVPLDAEGIVPERIPLNGARRAKLLYTVSSFQNPTGATLSESRRRRLVALAEEYDFLI